MVYVDNKETTQKCFKDVDVYKTKDGKITKIVLNF